MRISLLLLLVLNTGCALLPETEWGVQTPEQRLAFLEQSTIKDREKRVRRDAEFKKRDPVLYRKLKRAISDDTIILETADGKNTIIGR